MKRVSAVLSDLRGIIHLRFERYLSAESKARIAPASPSQMSNPSSPLTSKLSLRESVQPGVMSMTTGSTPSTSTTSKDHIDVVIKKENALQRLRNRFKGKGKGTHESFPALVASLPSSTKRYSEIDQMDPTIPEGKQVVATDAKLKSIPYSGPKFVVSRFCLISFAGTHKSSG